MGKRFPCLVFIVFFACSCKCRASDVSRYIGVCDFEGCYESGDNVLANYSGKKYYSVLYRMFSAGIPHILWEDVRSLVSNVSLSPGCKRSLLQVSDAMASGDEWAFRMVDSSAKTPAGFMRKTVTSLGDYDQCLDISAPKGVDPSAGKYCLVDVFPVNFEKKHKTKGKLYLDDLQHFKASAYYYGLCFPSSCSVPDIRGLLTAVLKPYPLLVKGEITCDTKASISWYNTITGLRLGQIIALLYVAGAVLLVAGGTLIHGLQEFVPWKEVAASLDHFPLTKTATDLRRALSDIFPLEKMVAFLVHFSMINTGTELVFVKSSARNRVGLTDRLKLILIASGTVAHIMCCLENPNGFMILGQQSAIKRYMSRVLLQPLFNEAGIVGITFLSGFATVWMGYPLALRRKLKFLPAILDRWIRFTPSVMSIVALDLIWPLVGSGPFFSRIASSIISKCSTSWWKNFLHISNWGPSIDICSGQTYFSAVDMQLFVLGLLAVYLLAKSAKLGIAFCCLGITFGTCSVAYYAHYLETTPTIMTSSPCIVKLAEFLDYIHMSTHSYFPSYFWGILFGYCIKKGYWIETLRKIPLFAWVLLFYIPLATASYLPMIANIYNALPQAWVPLYVIGVRLIMIYCTSCAVIWGYLLDFTGKETSASPEIAPEAEGKEEPKKVISLTKGLTRLSFAIYLSNYYFIRTDFFTQRDVFYNDLFPLVKRVLYSAIFIFFTAFAFHVLFVGPFDSLRKAMYTPREKQCTVDSKESNDIDNATKQKGA